MISKDFLLKFFFFLQTMHQTSKEMNLAKHESPPAGYSQGTLLAEVKTVS